MLDRTTIPESAIIIGGGAIGCEFASFLADVGSRVTILEAMPGILPGVDQEAAAIVGRMFKRRKVAVHTGVTVTEGRVTDTGVDITYSDGTDTTTISAEVVVVSVGRAPRSAGIGLEGSGVTIDARGYVEVDGRMRTAVPGVYALGDLVPTPALAHVAFAEAIVAIKDICGEEPEPIDHSRIPWGIYCHPEVAFCGPTEEAARAAGHDVVTSVHRFAGNSRAQIMGEADGLVKVVATTDGAILGVHIVGPWATELLAPGYLAVNWEATVDDVATLIQPHPTLGELFGESVLALTGRTLHG